MKIFGVDEYLKNYLKMKFYLTKVNKFIDFKDLLGITIKTFYKLH